MWTRPRPRSLLAGALAVHLLIVLAVLPFAHTCDDHGTGRSSSSEPSLDTGASARDRESGDCLACLFLAQARTGRPQAAPTVLPSERGPDRVELDRATVPPALPASPVLPRGPPAA